jgi:hypothetical protein
MKYIKLTAIILTAMLLLCSCGSAETVSAVETLPETAHTEIAENASQAAVSQTAAIPENIATSETTQTPAEEITFEDAVENAEIVFEKAEELFKKTIENNLENTHLLYVGVLGKSVAEMPDRPEVIDGEYVESALNFLTEGEIGGVYVLIADTDRVRGVLWSSSLNSTLVGTYPDPISEDNDMPIIDLLLDIYEVNSESLQELETQGANANAKLVFQNAATYVTLAQIKGATFDQILFSGSLTEKNDEHPTVDEGEALTSEDFTNALRYYMGGKNGGVYFILLDEYYNPLGVLWAQDRQTSVVGAYPVARTNDENESGNINTADINKAAGLD